MGDLRTFLSVLLEKRPEDLLMVDREVDPRFEIMGFVEKFERQKQAPVLLFKKVKGTSIPVLTNLHASFERLMLMFGTRTKEETVLEFMRRADRKIAPKVVDTGPVKERVLRGDAAKASILPQIVHNELDGGPYICSAGTIMKDPDTGALNVGLYRNQLMSDGRIGLMINPANHGTYILNRYRELNKPVEVALVIGHHPAFLLSAGGARLPYIGGELELAGALMDEPLRVVRGETVDLEYPADAEIVIEGVIENPSQLVEEGDFGEYPRYYSGKKMVPLIKVTAICMRNDAVYQDIAAAHDEHIVMGSLPRMATYLKRIKEVAPYVKMVNLPKSASSRAHIYVSIRKRNDGEGKQAGLAALAADPNIKMAIVVDEDIDVFDEEQVLWAVAFRFEADRDLVVIPYALGAHLNPSAYSVERSKRGVLQTRLIVDATWPLKGFEKSPVAKAPQNVVDKIGLGEAVNRVNDPLLRSLLS
ncbi:MAG: UbiD family decarboxylase [Candidatus Caldarchaeum sp.]|nr:UbiD family decarboxylase [Candidatus Caldarchaeum sp.]MDW8359032.1 UbiD family decarboxylase [Candidatus Caldarchaeum sp.]